MNMQIRFTKKGREEFLKIISVFSEFAGTRSATRLLNESNRRGEFYLNIQRVAILNHCFLTENEIIVMSSSTRTIA